MSDNLWRAQGWSFVESKVAKTLNDLDGAMKFKYLQGQSGELCERHSEPWWPIPSLTFLSHSKIRTCLEIHKGDRWRLGQTESYTWLFNVGETEAYYAWGPHTTSFVINGTKKKETLSFLPMSYKSPLTMRGTMNGEGPCIPFFPIGFTLWFLIFSLNF